MPKTNPRELRFKWYRLVERDHETVERACCIFGISRKTYYKWYKRDHGLGRNEHKPRIVHPQTKLTPEVRQWVAETKLAYNYGPRKMQVWLRAHHGLTISTTALYKFYKKRGLIRRPQKRLAWYQPLVKPYQATVPGENVQCDVKYVPGKRGRWAYQYRFIDTVTNLQFAVEMTGREARKSLRALRLAELSLPFKVRGVQTDNGAEFRGSFHRVLVQRGITQRFIPKRSAPWNGKVERANRSVDDEYYLNPTRPWKTLAAYTAWYNQERPHLGRGMRGLTPYQKFLALTSQVSPLKVN
jgi:IS30 family transposase